jgi:hypothetical protein
LIDSHGTQFALENVECLSCCRTNVGLVVDQGHANHCDDVVFVVFSLGFGGVLHNFVEGLDDTLPGSRVRGGGFGLEQRNDLAKDTLAELADEFSNGPGGNFLLLGFVARNQDNDLRDDLGQNLAYCADD